MSASHDTALNTLSTSNSLSNIRVPVTPGAMAKLRIANDANLSPNGQQVAFVVWEWLPEQPEKRSRIWLVETSGNEPGPLTKSHREDSCPRWSPDSKQLAFISKEVLEGNKEKEKAKAQPYLMAFPGGEPKQICTMPNGVSRLFMTKTSNCKRRHAIWLGPTAIWRRSPSWPSLAPSRWRKLSHQRLCEAFSRSGRAG